MRCFLNDNSFLINFIIKKCAVVCANLAADSVFNVFFSKNFSISEKLRFNKFVMLKLFVTVSPRKKVKESFYYMIFSYYLLFYIKLSSVCFELETSL